MIVVAAAFVAAGVAAFLPRSLYRSSTAPRANAVAQTLYVTRPAVVRNAPSTAGTQQLAMLERGTAIEGDWVGGARNGTKWLKINSGNYSGGYVSGVNLSPQARPNVVRWINADVTVTQQASILQYPAAFDSPVGSVSPGLTVRSAAEVEGGWIEIQRKTGGVGYVPSQTFGAGPGAP
jgi:hypothetical protein